MCQFFLLRVSAGTAGIPEGHQHLLAQDSDQQTQWAASDDLDSVIELLTNLSPNSTSNNNNNSSSSSQIPNQTTTLTPIECETYMKQAPSLPDEEVGSPSSTIDSRSSSRTRSSGRSSGSESGLKDRGKLRAGCRILVDCHRHFMISIMNIKLI